MKNFPGSTIFDLQKAMKTMTSLFHEDKHSTGDESQAFLSRLTPILQQMDNLRIHEDHSPSVLYSILAGDACKDCDGINIFETCLEDVLYEVKRKVPFDNEVKDRRMVCWHNVSFDQFRAFSDTEVKAAKST